MTDTPNPGSAEAFALGCTCPILDNHHGAGVVINGERNWTRNVRCPLHGTQAADAEEADDERTP